jgi:hypothetical protein
VDQAGHGRISAQGGQEEAIARLPARAADLAFEHGELVTEGEDLSSELVLGLATNQPEVEQEADQGVEEREGHDGGAWHRRDRRCNGLPG